MGIWSVVWFLSPYEYEHVCKSSIFRESTETDTMRVRVKCILLSRTFTSGGFHGGNLTEIDATCFWNHLNKSLSAIGFFEFTYWSYHWLRRISIVLDILLFVCILCILRILKCWEYQSKLKTTQTLWMSAKHRVLWGSITDRKSSLTWATSLVKWTSSKLNFQWMPDKK